MFDADYERKLVIANWVAEEMTGNQETKTNVAEKVAYLTIVETVPKCFGEDINDTAVLLKFLPKGSQYQVAIEQIGISSPVSQGLVTIFNQHLAMLSGNKGDQAIFDPENLPIHTRDGVLRVMANIWNFQAGGLPYSRIDIHRRMDAILAVAQIGIYGVTCRSRSYIWSSFEIRITVTNLLWTVVLTNPGTLIVFGADNRLGSMINNGTPFDPKQLPDPIAIEETC